MACSKLCYYKVRLIFNKYVENSFKAVKAVLIKDKLFLLVVVCVVIILGVAALIQSFEYDGVPHNENMGDAHPTAAIAP